MHEQPSTPPVPQLFVNSAPAPGLTSNLTSMVVHVVEGRATAEVGVVSPLMPPMPRVGVEATRLSIDLPLGSTVFSGTLTQIETRMDEVAAQSKVLHARGTAPEWASDSAMPLHIGAELVSGSVRRSADGATARCVAATVELRFGSRVTLITGDPEFDGHFEVTEIWHRFDTAGGLRVEFVASG